MEFSLYTSHLTDNYREGINPFTNEKVRFPIDSVLSKGELDGLVDYLKKLNATEEEDGTYVYVRISGNVLRIGASGLLRGENVVSCSIEYDKLTSVISEVLFNLCKLSNMIILAGVDDIAIMSGKSTELLDKRWPKQEYITKPKELLNWMKLREY